jgi:hypothetical protein
MADKLDALLASINEQQQNNNKRFDRLEALVMGNLGMSVAMIGVPGASGWSVACTMLCASPDLCACTNYHISVH